MLGAHACLQVFQGGIDNVRLECPDDFVLASTAVLNSGADRRQQRREPRIRDYYEMLVCVIGVRMLQAYGSARAVECGARDAFSQIVVLANKKESAATASRQVTHPRDLTRRTLRGRGQTFNH